jgi:hypothetical protein
LAGLWPCADLYGSVGKVSSSKILPETSAFRTETPSFRTETSGFSNRNFVIFGPKLRVFQPKLRVFENRTFVFLNQSCSFCKDFFRPIETAGVDFEIFCDQNFGISNPYEVSVERKPEKFSKFQVKMNYCVEDLFVLLVRKFCRKTVYFFF